MDVYLLPSVKLSSASAASFSNLVITDGTVSWGPVSLYWNQFFRECYLFLHVPDNVFVPGDFPSKYADYRLTVTENLQQVA